MWADCYGEVTLLFIQRDTEQLQGNVTFDVHKFFYRSADVAVDKKVVWISSKNNREKIEQILPRDAALLF
jgi:hypothetical protein